MVKLGKIVPRVGMQVEILEIYARGWREEEPKGRALETSLGASFLTGVA